VSDYLYDEDGKLHTRYSELAQCTPGAIANVIAERTGARTRFESEAMAFGTDRHEMWAEEALETGKTPACFGVQFDADEVESEYATEILRGVVLHSRMDAVSFAAKAVIDYKTLCAENLEIGRIKARTMYSSSKQLPLYAVQLAHHGKRIKRKIYMVEIWNKTREEILGYEVIDLPVKMSDMAKILPWVVERVSLLASAIEQQELTEA
jgi:hypothetical protein